MGARRGTEDWRGGVGSVADAGLIFHRKWHEEELDSPAVAVSSKTAHGFTTVGGVGSEPAPGRAPEDARAFSIADSARWRRRPSFIRTALPPFLSRLDELASLF